jgi:cytochrome c551/c552
MTFERSGRRIPALAILLVGLVVISALAACAPNADAAIISPDLGEVLAAEAEGQVVVREPTPEPPKLVSLTPEEQLAGVPDDLAAAILAGNVESGATLATSNGCIGCHALDPAAQMTGPTWYNIGDTAVSRVAGESPGEYLHLSIVAPNDFVVTGYPANIMPQTYVDTLSTEQLGDIIAYLLSQNGQ